MKRVLEDYIFEKVSGTQCIESNVLKCLKDTLTHIGDFFSRTIIVGDPTPLIEYSHDILQRFRDDI